MDRKLDAATAASYIPDTSSQWAGKILVANLFETVASISLEEEISNRNIKFKI
jgi:hypothetical protein